MVVSGPAGQLASSLLGGRPVMVFSDQAFLKPPGGGGPKPYHQECDEWLSQRLLLPPALLSRLPKSGRTPKKLIPEPEFHRVDPESGSTLSLL